MSKFKDLSITALDVAGAIISDARNVHGPIVFITGNSYFPPARAIGAMEELFQQDMDDAGERFEMVWEEVESLCARASVYLDCGPDGSVYAVDLLRWEYIDEDDNAENLSDEYRYIGG